ncbi:S46 family peptidase [Draconibacterium sp. IB214405]|uniref:S46 family peptidase n=1 Tax=Draconibacterium sp. IB214405 TaxID=3097352 RepID=UPI002A1632B5|nr:S46 family peptidase [Draconibacterium sp. IB214405]MDX8337578.1 S46 family peptidase [Draconibacterium sp. IB214405]
MMRKLNLVLLLTIVMIGSAVAKEGMWLPSLIHKLNIKTMQDMGCELSAEDIYSINQSSLKDAIVALDRGSCTAEVISKDGLLLTNHHCGFGEIQQHSSVEHDYLQDGFWAMSKEEELPNPGKTVTFLISVEDVTAKVLAEVTDDMTESERSQKIDEATRQLEREAKGDTHYEVYIRDFFKANQYFLFVTETFKDVRLVGAPPQALGKFGGDTDNWMWPRHTNDFSMFRVYCAPDGTPAEYSEDNVPYQPKHHLPISLKGVKENDFAMVFGYPGSTNRYKTSWGIDYTMQVTNTARIVIREKKLEIIADYMATSQKAKIQYASKHASSANYYKNAIGQNEALTKLGIIAQKQELENEFTNWVDASADRKAKYGEALPLIEESYKDVEAEKAMEYAAEALLRGPEIFMFAYRANQLADLLEKPEENKDRIEALAARLAGTLDGYFKDYDAATDEKIVAALLKIYADNNASKFYPEFYSEIQNKYKGDYEKYAAKMFQKSIFDNQEELSAFLENPSLKVLEKDMAFQAAVEIFDMYRSTSMTLRQGNEQLLKGRRLFVAGLMEMQPDKKFYPDANSTMRLTYGTVMPYDPRDGVTYKYYTTTDGYLEKEIPGDYEFDVPKRMKELLLDKNFGQYADEDGKLRACFITDNDITGGNSGSPVINGKGELIGIAFDGNWEAMSGDLDFEENLQRCINVDIRFVLWVVDVYAGAQNLIDEMTIIR